MTAQESQTAAPEKRGYRKVRTGRVISSAMKKTIVVEVQRLLMHPLYGRVVKRTTKFYAHDERGEAGEGDLVKIIETRPLSKLKRWRLVEIVEKSK